MSVIAILGAGAFGSALAIALGTQHQINLWGRNLAPNANSSPRLPNYTFPQSVTPHATAARAIQGADIVLIALPMRGLSAVFGSISAVTVPVIACCKGIDPATLTGPTSILSEHTAAPTGILTGPSFAADIAAGLPTALTLALDASSAATAQEALSTRSLRIYRTADVVGAELGGALKNVLAIASGACAGAGLGQSAQAALLTRGYAEARTFAAHRGAKPETTLGLSGLGDLMLTAWSDGSRNFRFGRALGQGTPPDQGTTTEGVATAAAIAKIAQAEALDLPVLTATHRLITGERDIKTTLNDLMTRPLKEE